MMYPRKALTATVLLLATPALTLIASPQEAVLQRHVHLQELPSGPAPIYQSAWKLSYAVDSGSDEPLVFTLEMQGDPLAAATVLEDPEWPLDKHKAGSWGSSVTVGLLNPDYADLRFTSERLAESAASGALTLETALDALVQASGGRFVWRLDRKHGVVNIIERELAECPEWHLNHKLPGTPFSATGVIPAVDEIAARSGGLYPYNPEARRWEPLKGVADDNITVEGATVREAVNSVIGKSGRLVRFYEVSPLPPRSRTAPDLSLWLSGEDVKWQVYPRDYDYSEMLSWTRGIQSTMKFRFPERHLTEPPEVK